MVMFMLMVWRPYCEKHCPLKEHMFVSKRVGFESLWKILEIVGRAGLSNSEKLAKFVFGYLFSQSLFTNKCLVPYACPL